MNQKIKQRLVGVFISLALIIIVAPMIFKDERLNEHSTTLNTDIPNKPSKTDDNQHTQDTELAFVVDSLDYIEENNMVFDIPTTTDSELDILCVIKIGSFSDSSNVKRIKDKLEGEGYQVSTANLTLHSDLVLEQVFVNSEQHCDQTMAELSLLGFNGIIVENEN